MMICRRRKAVGAAFSVSLFCFLLFMTLADCNRRITVTISSLSRSLKPVEAEKRGLRQSFDVNYVSKRRVPNGPDPIHNRGAGTSRLPPT